VSTWAKSMARIAWARVVRNCFHVGPDRRGDGSRPVVLRIFHTVDAARTWPSPMSSPWMRRYPHPGFSRASWSTRSRTGRRTGGRPGWRRGLLPSKVTMQSAGPHPPPRSVTQPRRSSLVATASMQSSRDDVVPHVVLTHHREELPAPTVRSRAMWTPSPMPVRPRRSRRARPTATSAGPGGSRRHRAASAQFALNRCRLRVIVSEPGARWALSRHARKRSSPDRYWWTISSRLICSASAQCRA
jgi:hypothetical protein